MHIISFATKETNWVSLRMGIILHVGDHDTGGLGNPVVSESQLKQENE